MSQQAAAMIYLMGYTKPPSIVEQKQHPQRRLIIRGVDSVDPGGPPYNTIDNTRSATMTMTHTEVSSHCYCCQCV